MNRSAPDADPTAPQPLGRSDLPDLRRWAAATVELAAGVPAVLLLAAGAADRLTSGVDEARAVLLLSGLLAAVWLTVCWVRARRSRRWLGTLLVSVLVLTAVVLGGARWILAGTDRVRDGWWEPVWLAGLAVLLWVVVALACAADLWWSTHPSRRPARPRGPGWRGPLSVLAPVAVLGVAGALVVTGLPGWMERSNHVLEPGADPVPPSGSALDGSVRWEQRLPGTATLLASPEGLAVGTEADAVHSAGVLLLDPTAGTVRWRQQLRGSREAPELRVGAGGRAVVVGRPASEVGSGTTVLDPASGALRALWPDVAAVDPPVRLDKVPQGTNTVVALQDSGSTRWRYRPDGCDPRATTSTPEVVMVVRRTCERDAEGRRGLELVGLDAGTGDPRWRVPTEQESAPEQVLVGAGFQLELGDGQLRRRDLADGALGWETPGPRGCDDEGSTSAAGGLVAVLDCGADGGASTVRVLQVEDGRSVRTLEHPTPLHRLLVLDDGSVLALASREGRCELRVALPEQGWQTVTGWTAEARDPQDDPGREPEPGAVRCADSSAHQVAGAVVVGLRVVDPTVEDGTSTRLVGLA